MAAPVERLSGRAKARPLREGQLRIERLAGDVPLRLEEEQPASRTEGDVKLSEKPLAVADLVEDVNCDGEVDDSRPGRSSAAPCVVSSNGRRRSSAIT